MKHKRVKALTSTDLSKLTTPRLRAYRKKLLQLEQSVELSDLNDAELASLESGYLYFKETPAWAYVHSAVVALLHDRPVP